MEFLSPEEKRQKTIKIFLGYCLGLLVILGGTIVISFILQGFDIFSRQTVVKNGLLFIDSKPVSSQIFLNGDSSKRTDARFVLPEGNYNLSLSQDGYREWQKRVQVFGGRVVYHVYPRLYPNDIKTSDIASFSKLPFFYTQSPDRRWILIATEDKPSQILVYNTSAIDDKPQIIELPVGIWSESEATTTKLETIEWSTDNKNVLVQKVVGANRGDYLIINREKPTESINLTKTINLNAVSTVKLRDKKPNKFYILDNSSKILRTATLEKGIEPTVIADGVVDYKPYKDNVVFYATTIGVPDNQLAVRLIRDNTTHLFEPIIKSDTVLLDLAQFDNDWYYVAGSGSQNFTAVYINPLNTAVKPNDNGIYKPQLRLLLDNPKSVSFSDNARFIGLQSKDKFDVYDGELKQVYRYDSPVELPAGGAKWMDGHRWHTVSGGREQVFEYDGLNKQSLVAAIDDTQVFYDKDYVVVYSLVKKDDGTVSLNLGRLTLD